MQIGKLINKNGQSTFIIPTDAHNYDIIGMLKSKFIEFHLHLWMQMVRPGF